MNLESIFKIGVVVFTVSNLAALGLGIGLGEALRALRDARLIILTLAWGWVVGPALAWLLLLVIPLAPPHAAGLLLISMAPTAPFFPLVARRARGDMTFAAAFVLLSTVGTVVFLPLMVPVLIKGLTVSTWALARPLLTMVLLPLVLGIVIRGCSVPVAGRLFVAVRGIAGISTLAVLVLVLTLYGKTMLSAVGTYAVGTQILFILAMTLLTYKVGFGLGQRQRSAMSLGMCTRNIAAVFVAYFGITNPDPGIFVMLVLVIPLTLVVSFVAASAYAARSGGTDVGGPA